MKLNKRPLLQKMDSIAHASHTTEPYVATNNQKQKHLKGMTKL